MTSCIGTEQCVCGPGGDVEPTSDCHCLEQNTVGEYVSNGICTVIEQAAYERALSIFLFLYVIIVIIICTFWLVIFWRSREEKAYVASLKVRRPIYMILSYVLFLPWVFENSISLIYLYWSTKDPARNQEWDGINEWTSPDGDPIYYGREVDYVMHFFWWFGFWAFVQLKVFKLWMLRYDYEYAKEMSNIVWRDHLGLRTVEATSFFIRYRSILGNAFLMFFLQLVILIIIIFIQIFVRLIPQLQDEEESSQAEQIFIIIFVILEFSVMSWLMRQIRKVDDNFHLAPESHRVFIVGFIGILCWIFGIIIWLATNLSYIWFRTGITILIVTWICCFCYIETLWVLKKLDTDYFELQSYGSQDTNQKLLQLRDILKTQEGFEAMMRFLVTEYSCENLLCYVEISQYIVAWGPKRMQDINNNGNDGGYNQLDYDSNNQQLQQQSTGHKYKGSYVDQLENNLNPENAIDEFPYFENPEFTDELGHYEYIMQKYIYDSASLQINISGSARQQIMQLSPGVDSDQIMRQVKNIRNELWSLMRDAFTRFRTTSHYQKLIKQLQKKQQNDNDMGNELLN